MEDSNQQFRTLLAHLMARSRKMLAEQEHIYPLSLALLTNGDIEVGVGVPEAQDQVPSVLNAMQQALIKRVSAGGVQATCVAYADCENDRVVALLENNEDCCATVILPVLAGPAGSLDANMEVKDGSVYIFPLASDR